LHWFELFLHCFALLPPPLQSPKICSAPPEVDSWLRPCLNPSFISMFGYLIQEINNQDPLITYHESY
jgi:hypothetical protein